ncbi:MAG: PrgI family protein [Butyrivibrio sp.]|nr:PrgI family protein [Butyrivibrio sp.]
MITVEMSDDIRKYENKSWGPFTTRQAVCIGLGVLVAGVIALLIPVDTGNKITIGLILMIPFFLCGFVKLDGAYFETIAINMLYLYVLTPRKRKNIQKNTFAEEYKELLKREEQIKISKMDAATKKKYMATHGPKKKITYSSREEFKVYR